MAQTAVEWLIENLTMVYPRIEEMKLLNDKAKHMEKQQIINADSNATIRTAKGFNADVSVRRVKELAEEYYKETYNK
jgi:CMP-N-acetylneuraminic acid synthetase